VPWELLYADDLVLLVLMADSIEQLKEKILNWKRGMEAKGLKVNVGKTKVMIAGEGTMEIEATCKWPCGVCNKGVGRNSIKCTSCQKWVHNRCSNVTGSLKALRAIFVCRKCERGAQEVEAVGDENLDIGDGVVLEKVTKFCYLGDMLDAEGGADSAVTARVRGAWKKFRELSPILTFKGASLSLKGKVYNSCVRSCMLYGSETWQMKVEHEEKLERTEMRMIRWMCGVSLRDKRTNADLRKRIGVEPIGVVLRRNRLRWFGHVERKKDNDWVKRSTTM
jgi:hypothetical protein